MNHQNKMSLNLLPLLLQICFWFVIAPLDADLFLFFFCYVRLHVVSFSESNQAGVIEALTLPQDI